MVDLFEHTASLKMGMKNLVPGKDYRNACH